MQAGRAGRDTEQALILGKENLRKRYYRGAITCKDCLWRTYQITGTQFTVNPIDVRLHLLSETAFLAVATMLAALRPNMSSSSTAGPLLPNLSLTPTRSTGTGFSSHTTSQTALPRPPIMLCSSAVTIAPVFAAESIPRRQAACLRQSPFRPSDRWR